MKSVLTSSYCGAVQVNNAVVFPGAAEKVPTARPGRTGVTLTNEVAPVLPPDNVVIAETRNQCCVPFVKPRTSYDNALEPVFVVNTV